MVIRLEKLLLILLLYFLKFFFQNFTVQYSFLNVTKYYAERRMRRKFKMQVITENLPDFVQFCQSW